MLRTALHQALLATLCTLSFVSCLPAAAQEAPNDALPAAPEGAVEVVARRGTHSQTFQKGNQFILRTYTGPVFYDADGQGSLRPVRTDLKPSARGGGAAYEATENRARVFLPGSANGPVTVESRGYEVSFQPVGAQEAPGRLTGSSGGMAFPQAFALGDLEYQVLRRGGVKETVVLRDASSPRTYRWRLRSTRLQARLEGKRVLLADTAAGLSDPELVMPAPYAEDARGKRTEEIEVTLTGLQDGVYDLTYTLPDAFCQSAVYPVRMDPTLTIRPDSSLAREATLDNCSTRHSKWEGYLSVGADPDGLQGTNCRSYLAFPLVSGGMPANSTITGASVALWGLKGWCANVELFGVTEPWTDDALSECPDPVNPTALVSASMGSGMRNYLQSTALTEWVRSLYENGRDNQGFGLRCVSGPGMQLAYSWKDSSLRPYLEVTYSSSAFVPDAAKAGPPPRWEGGVSAGPAMVNLRNGSLHFAVPLYSYPTLAGSVGVTLYYNSLESSVGALGPKWSHSFASRLSITGASPSRTVTEILGDGSRVTYTESGAGNFVGPAYSFESLSVEGSGFVVGCCGQTKRHYDAAGLLRSVEDRHGNRLTLNYNAQNQVTSVSAAGRGDTAWNQFEYTSGKLTAIRDRLGNCWTLYYQGDYLKAIQLPGDYKAWNFAYSADGALTALGSPNRNYYSGSPVAPFLYDYDKNLRVVSCLGPPPYSGGVSYALFLRYQNAATLVTDVYNRTTTYGYHLVTGPPAYALLETVTDPLGYVTTNRWDESRRLVTGTRTPTNQLYGDTFWTTETTYNSKGKVLTSTRNLHTGPGTYRSLTTTYEYDHTTQQSPTKVVSPTGEETLFYYDGETPSIPWAQTVGWRDLTRAYLPKPTGAPEVGYTEMSYNTNGTLASRRDARGNVTTYQYSAAGDLLGVTDPLSRKTEMTYDAAGRRTSRWISVNGSTVVPATSYTYSADRFYQEQGSGGSITHYWMPTGPVREVQNPQGGADALLTYNDVGLMATQNDVSYTYDAMGRQTAGYRNESSAVQKWTYTYTERGQLHTVRGGGDVLQLLATYAYDADGQQTGLSFGNGETSARTYDNLGRLTRVEDLSADGQTIISSSEVSYDDSDRVTQVISRHGPVGAPTIRTATYGYDARGQLTSETVTGPNPVSMTYGYDLTGNRTRAEDLRTGVRYDYTYDGANQVSSRQKYVSGVPQGSPQPYTHDYEGNLTGDPDGRQHTYTRRNRLGRSSYLNSWGWREEVYQTWDALDRRVQTLETEQPSTDERVRYVYDGSRVIQETMLDNPSSVSCPTRYVYGNQPVARTSWVKDAYGYHDYVTFYLHFDYLGSLTAITHPTQGVWWRQSSDAWGSHLQTTDSAPQPWPPNDRGYAGAWGYDRDLSGLYHVGVRAYDPALGRFLQRDPAGAGHPYAYCDNGPTNAVDPTGEASERTAAGYRELIRTTMEALCQDDDSFLANNAWLLVRDKIKTPEEAAKFARGIGYQVLPAKGSHWKVLTPKGVAIAVLVLGHKRFAKGTLEVNVKAMIRTANLRTLCGVWEANGMFR